MSKGIKHGLASEEKDKEKLYKNIFRRKKFQSDYTYNEIAMIDSIIYDPLKIESADLYKNNKLLLYGSHVYKGNTLAGDIDLMQVIPKMEQAKALQHVMNYLYYKDYKNNGYFLGDIKCGLVSKFKGLASHIGTFKNKKVINYNYEACKFAFNLSADFTENKLTLPKQTNTITEKIDYLKCYQLAHELITRRWTPEEIIEGFQKNEDGSDYTLNEAVYESELTKYDVFYYNNSVYTEITNTLIDNNNEKDINEDFKNGVILNMLIQYFVKDNKLKAIKRLYALERMNKNIDMCLLLHDFTQRSLVGKYNDIINDLKVFIYIVENYAHTFAMNPNDGRDRKLSAHITSIQSLILKLFNPYDKHLTKINEIIDKYIYTKEAIYLGEYKEVKTCLYYCDKIIEYFSKKIDKLCVEFIKANKINFQVYL